MEKQKHIALVAHDHRKKSMIEWVEWNYKKLLTHELTCTGTTGKMIKETIEKKLRLEDVHDFDVDVNILKSGPLGGDQQLGSLIADGKIDLIIFFWDPMEPHPHDVDVKALLRISVLYNVPMACNRSSADFMISSPLMESDYKPVLTDYSVYIKRGINLK